MAGPEEARGGEKFRKMPRNGLGRAENRRAGLIFAPAGESGGLADPAGQAGVVGRVVFVDVEIAHVGILGGAGRERAQVGAAEEGDFDIARQTMETEEPALAGP